MGNKIFTNEFKETLVSIMETNTKLFDGMRYTDSHTIEQQTILDDLFDNWLNQIQVTYQDWESNRPINWQGLYDLLQETRDDVAQAITFAGDAIWREKLSDLHEKLSALN